MTPAEQSQHVEAFMKGMGFVWDEPTEEWDLYSGEMPSLSYEQATFMWRATVQSARDELVKVPERGWSTGAGTYHRQKRIVELDRLLEPVETEE